MYNTGGGLGLASAYTWVYTMFVLLFVGVALLLLSSRERNKNIKLTSIQRKMYQQLIERRQALEEEVEYARN
jgi:uncharacterized protein (DUF58 family)